VAWHTKSADPASWVVRIILKALTSKLEKINTNKFNLNLLVKFLCSTAFPKSKYTGIERLLLKQALQRSGNITVLMDGFFEVSPNHMVKAAIILSVLMTTKVKEVWVTSRPVQKVA
jgi:hypothetical protein